MGTRKAIVRSVTVYNKTLSNQCKFTAQIDQVQDKYLYRCIKNRGVYCECIKIQCILYVYVSGCEI